MIAALSDPGTIVAWLSHASVTVPALDAGAEIAAGSRVPTDASAAPVPVEVQYASAVRPVARATSGTTRPIAIRRAPEPSPQRGETSACHATALPSKSSANVCPWQAFWLVERLRSRICGRSAAGRG